MENPFLISIKFSSVELRIWVLDCTLGNRSLDNYSLLPVAFACFSSSIGIRTNR